MRHRKFGKHLGRSTGQRNALRRTLITQLFTYERIRTTRAKADAVRGAAEHMITMAKRSLVHPDPMRVVHVRRLLNGRLDSNDVAEKVISVLAPRYAERPGGYTRVYKLGPRKGDAAEMVLLELVDRGTDDEDADGTAAQGVGGRARGLLNRIRGRGRTATSASPAETGGTRDKLTRIEGIGPAVQKALYDSGITTFEALASTAAADLTRIVKDEKKVNIVGDAATWPRQAQYIVDGDDEGLKAYQDRLIGGREPNE